MVKVFMGEIIIKAADNDKYGASKENIFYAYENGEICEGVYLYPFEGSPNIEFPRNIIVKGKTWMKSLRMHF